MVVHRQGEEPRSRPRHYLPGDRGSVSELRPDVVGPAGDRFQHGRVRADRRLAEHAGAHVRLRQSLARHRQAHHAPGDHQSCRSKGQKSSRHGRRPASDHDGHLSREERDALQLCPVRQRHHGPGGCGHDQRHGRGSRAVGAVRHAIFEGGAGLQGGGHDRRPRMGQECPDCRRALHQCRLGQEQSCHRAQGNQGNV